MLNISKIGIIGAGTMGAALAQKFAQENFKVKLFELDPLLIEKGIAGIKNTLREGVTRKIFSEEEAENYISNIEGHTHLMEVYDCDLVIEAIYEDFEAKKNLLQAVSQVVDNSAIIATNTSSFSVTELAEAVKIPERFLGMHYFYHAAKNRLVEIIPGKETSEETFETMMNFAPLSGKDAITCKDSYGFVVNRFFVPWLNEATRIYEEGLACKEEIDKVCEETFNISMGPFRLMNATGIPVAYHAQKTLEVFGPFYRPSKTLQKQAELRQPWELKESPETTSNTTLISERMLGVVFLVCAQLLEEEVCSAAAINRGARIGLRWKKGPIDLMSQRSENEVRALVQKITDLYGVEMPNSISKENWKMEFVNLSRKKNVAVITMSRPEDMNALNETVMQELDTRFSEAETDPEIDTIILTGTGKAFVAGADIKFFVKNIRNNSIKNIVEFARYGHQVFDKIDNSQKRVIAVLNGLALGGGLELALCADTILAVPKTRMAFPETGIGIFPGLGGTQRCTRRLGKGLAKWLILTGSFLNPDQALEIGLIDYIIEPDQIPEILSGKIAVREKVREEINPKWNMIAKLYDNNSYHSIIEGHYHNGDISEEFISGLVKMMSVKAPVAMDIAEKLIDSCEGCDGEIRELSKVFATEDAYLGLSSIGQKVKYLGK